MVAEPGVRAGDPAAVHTLAAFLWRRKAVMALCAICGLLAGGVATFLMKPVYRGRTSLQLEDFNDQALYQISPVSPVIPNTSPENYLQNQVKLLESNTLARRVADRMGIGPMPDQKRVDLVRKALRVRTSLQSQVIEIFYADRDPVRAARGANAAASEFMNLNREARWQLVQDTTEWLNKQSAELKAKLESQNAQLQDFASRAGLILTDGEHTPAEDSLREIQEAYTRAQADRAAKQARYDAAAANRSDLSPDGTSASPLHQYQTDLETMRRQLAELRTIYAPDYYKVTRLRAQISEVQAAIDQERKSILERARTDYVAAAGLEQMLSKSLADEMRKVQHQTEEQRHYNVLRNELETTQKLYDSVLEKAKTAGAESSMRMTNVRVIDAALPPSLPYSPNLPLNLAVGLAAGSIFGVGLAFLGARPGRVKQPGELTNFRELGVVPSAGRTRTVHAMGRDPGGLAIWESEQPSLFKESLRAVLTSILFRAPGGTALRQRGRVYVVASADMAEGKTTIVTNLGIASAERKQNVLLIDADLRRPCLHERFQLANGRGLAELLRTEEAATAFGAVDLESYVQRTQIPNLSVLTGGADGTASPEVLYSASLPAVLQRLERHFDLIFIDVPPMLLYSDARILGKLSDGLVMVVRANRWRREELGAVYQGLLQDQIPVLGTILNDWKMGAGQARVYERQYGHYHGRGAAQS
ncbi:MAG TPA: polysaccharide biosynthesis tyrosine autokinase [Bryobacteraceae bacterium]|nr:polysaccharide biosynthesis tyrosine autokinase [Bryobacteraceae bacterium]